MSDEVVTGREFERWMQLLAQQNRDILAEQRAMSKRVTALETERTVTKRVAALVSAAIGGGIALLGLIIQYFSGLGHKP